MVVNKNISVKWSKIELGKSAILKARIGWQGLTTAEYKKSGNYYLITGTDFKNGRIDWDNCHFVSKHRYDQDKYIQVHPNDVLVTKDGTIGKVAYVDQEPLKTTLNSGVFVIRPINKAFFPNYFYYVLRSIAFTDFLNRLTAGSTISHLYQKDFVNFSFALPPLSEQKAIAEVLSDVDALIQSLEQKIAKKKAIKEGMMQELLRPKEGWEVRKLGEVVTISTGAKNTQDKEKDGKYPFFVRSQKIEKISTYSFDGEAILTAGDGVGTGKVFHYINGKFDIHQRVYCLHSFKPEILGYYAFLFFKKNFFDRVSQMTAKSSVDSVRKEMISEMEFTYPNIEMQTTICNALRDQESSIKLLTGKLTKAKKLKQGLMQNLLTGKIRLKH